ncbi:lipoprotein [Erwinia typographi]|uniref:Lipoprotein n=1 Tax=Erwinia typographi TaxID=371042 RepID=A0A0A3YH89_9GAMM|nr:lipoprotein [Erwinia typographi]KGT86142.1 lipoprotein [Erwinia typographi]
MKKIFIVLLVLVLGGCATKPVSNQAAKTVPKDRMLNTSLLTKTSADAGTVTIKRDSGFAGSACLTRVYIDGKEIADLDTSEKVVIFPSSGNHVFSAWPKGICGGGMVEVTGNVDRDKPLTYRIGYGTNGDFGLYPTAF